MALQAKLGPDDPDTLRCQNNLANIYLDTGRVKQATELHEKTLKAGERTGRERSRHVDQPGEPRLSVPARAS